MAENQEMIFVKTETNTGSKGQFFSDKQVILCVFFYNTPSKGQFFCDIQVILCVFFNNTEIELIYLFMYVLYRHSSHGDSTFSVDIPNFLESGVHSKFHLFGVLV